MLIARHIRRVVTCAKSLAPTLNYSRTEAALSERLSAARKLLLVSAPAALCVKTCGHHGLPNLVTHSRLKYMCAERVDLDFGSKNQVAVQLIQLLHILTCGFE